MTSRVDRGHICVTPDGPKGPRRHVHQGLAYLSSRTGLPIVGAGMAFQRPWRAKSWDRFAVPRAFAPAACVVPEAVVVPPTPAATSWKIAAAKSSAGCRPPPARPRPGSSSFEPGHTRRRFDVRLARPTVPILAKPIRTADR